MTPRGRFAAGSLHVRPVPHQRQSFPGIKSSSGIRSASHHLGRIFRLQAETIALAGVIAAFALNGGLSGGTLVDHPDRYSDNVIKAGVIATMFWAAAGLLAGVVIAAQLSWPTIFYFPDAGWLNFGRLRPLHTSAVIFAFGGNVLIATSFFWVVQRTCKAKLARRRSRRGSCSGAIICSSSWPAPAI
jgi:hypothetical protein